MTPPIRTTPSLANNAHGKEPIRINLHWDIDRDLSEKARATIRQWLAPDPCRPVGECEIQNFNLWAIGLARGLIEVLCGTRPVEQMTRWLIPPLYAAVCAARTENIARGVAREVCRPASWRICLISPQVVEMCVNVSGPVQRHVVGLRLEAFRRRWIVTAIDLV